MALRTQLPLRTKLILVAAIPGMLATIMFNFSSQVDGTAAVALYRFALTFSVTAVNFCLITWISHRVSEIGEDFTFEQRLHRKVEERVEAAEKRADEAERKNADLDDRVKKLEQANKCRDKMLQAWTSLDDAKVFEMFLRLRENDGQAPN